MSLGFIGEIARAFEGMVGSVSGTLNSNEEQRSERTRSHYANHNVGNITTTVLLIGFALSVLWIINKN